MPKITCTYNDERHSYCFCSSKKVWPVLSVTQILRDSGQISQYGYNQDARQRGTAVHECIKSWLDGNEHDVPLEYRGYTQAFRAWVHAVNFSPVCIESIVYSVKYGYAGRLDLVGTINKRLAIIDIKTGAIPAWVNLQLVAYWRAYTEMAAADGMQCNPDRYALQLKANGQYKLKPYGNTFSDWSRFAGCAAIRKVTR